MSAAMMADDGFAGAGGWDLAAEALGIHARGIEIMPEARATRDAAGLTTIHDDVWTFTPDGRAIGKIDSPPCPTFSAAGKGTGRAALDSVMAAIHSGAYLSLDQLRHYPVSDDDDRTRLVLTPLHFATGYEYEWLAWEQVPAVLPVWEACAEVLRAQGWFVATGVLHAEQYGVPQTRRRAKLIASRLGPVELPTPTHSRYHSRTPDKLDPGVEKWVSMAEALMMASDRGSSVQLRNNTSANAAVRHETYPAPTLYFGQRLNKMVWEPTDLVGFPRRADTDDVVTIDGQDYRARDLRTADQPALTVSEKARSWQRFSHMGDVYNSKGCIREVTDPAPTMTASMDNGNFRWNQNGEVTGSQRVTVAEAAVLQSFPADMPWQGNQTKQFLQVGNAVPPQLALHSLQAAAVHHLAARGEAVA